jgi:hypothetical protein
MTPSIPNYSFHIYQDPLKPVNENEYNSIKTDTDDFVWDFMESVEEDFKKRRNPHGFDLKFFLIMLIIGIILIGTGYLIKEAGYFDTGDTFEALALIPFLFIFFQPIRYIQSAQKMSFEKTKNEREANTYYRFHATKIQLAKNYPDYLKILSETTNKEYRSFIWDNG